MLGRGGGRRRDQCTDPQTDKNGWHNLRIKIIDRLVATRGRQGLMSVSFGTRVLFFLSKSWTRILGERGLRLAEGGQAVPKEWKDARERVCVCGWWWASECAWDWMGQKRDERREGRITSQRVSFGSNNHRFVAVVMYEHGEWRKKTGEIGETFFKVIDRCCRNSVI